MQNWTRVCNLDDIPPHEQGGKYIVIGDKQLAVWKLSETDIRVIDDTCPHAGASLSGGAYIDEENCILCPMHAWLFSIETGQCPDNPAVRVNVYETKVADGVVWFRTEPDKK